MSALRSLLPLGIAAALAASIGRAENATLAAPRGNVDNGAPAAAAANAAPWFEDTAHLLGDESERAKAFNDQLAAFERATGVRIVARLYAKSPSAAEDSKAGVFMQGLARKYGTLGTGAMVAYFADEDDWRVWVGDGATSAFLGRRAAAGDLVEDGAFHRTKEAFLEAARAKADAAFAEQQRKASGPLPPGEKLTLQVEAILTGLTERLAPKP